MSSRRCVKCGRQYPASYQTCPYCSGREERGRRRPASRLEQIMDFLRQHSQRIFFGGCAFFLCIALLGILITRCSEPREEKGEPAPVASVAAEPLSLSRNVASVLVGETVTVTVSGGFDTLIWTSSDEAVASVDSGRVTGKAPGTATVTASTGIDSVSCEILVEEPAEAVPALALNHKDFTLRAGDPPVQMKAFLSGTRTVYDGEVVWASGDPGVVTVSDAGLVERVGKGTTVITATAGDQVLECVVRVP